VTISEFLPITRDELERLSTYNSQVKQGILHNTDYVHEMKELQQRFDESGWFRIRKRKLWDQS